MSMRRLSRWVALAVLGTVAVAATLLVLLLSDAPPPISYKAAQQRGAAGQALAASLDKSLGRSATAAVAVAVLPFAAPADDQDLIYLGEAMCEAVLGRLSRHPTLRATSCGSARVAVQAGVDHAQLAHLLGVERLLTGSLARSAGGAFQVRAQLADAKTARVLWSLNQEFDEARLQELPARLVERISASFATADVTQQAEPANGRAYRLYLQAVALTRRGGADNLRTARKLLDESLALAPEDPAALLASVSLSSQLVSVGIGKGSEVDAEVKRSAAILQRVDPDGPQALTLAASAAVGERRWRAAYEAIDAAAAGSPNHGSVLHTQAGLLLMMGYVRRAQDVALRVALQEPLVASAHERLARAHSLLGDDPRMLESTALARDLGFGARVANFEALAALRRGDAAGAERGWRDMLQIAGLPHDWAAAMVRAALDPARRAESIAVLDAVPAETRARLNELFLAYAIAGDSERALQALERMSRQAATMWASDLWLPEMAAVRRHPRFAAYLQANGLPELWDAHGAPDLCDRQADGTYACR